MGAAASSAAKGGANVGLSRGHQAASRAFAASKNVDDVQNAAAVARSAGGKVDEVALTVANRTAQSNSFKAIIKNPYASKAEKMAAQQGLKDLGVKRGASGFAFRPVGSVKIGNIVKVAASTGIAGVVAWLTFRGLGGVPGSEQLGEIVDETDPNAGGMLDMGSPQFAWMSICACCCLCCVCLVLLIVAMSA